MTTDADPDLESTPPCRKCWANCGVEAADEEMREIDRLEDELSPLPENITRIRKLVSALELCHHKAERWVTNIIEAIGETGELDNTLVIYIMGDNGASAEGSPQGLLNEMTFFNNIKEPFEQVLAQMDDLGGNPAISYDGGGDLKF